MLDDKRRNIDLDDTVELPVIDPQDHHKDKDPIGIIFPFVAKIGIFLGILLTITLIGRAIYINLFGKDISLLSNTQISFTGTNGTGTISSSFEPEKEALKQLKEDYRNKQRNKQDTSSLGTLIKSIDCSFSQSENLSNGMVITYACKYDHEAASKSKYNFKDISKTYTVTGLKQVEEIDVFEDIQTEWNLVDGIPTLSISNSKYNDLDISYSYTLDSLSQATITASFNEEELKKKGYQINNTSQTIDIPSLPSSIYSDTITTFLQENTSSILSDLDECSSYSFGKEMIDAYDPKFNSYTINEDGSVTVTYDIHNIYTDQFSNYYFFTISYTGYLYQESNQIYFYTETKHACMYDGYGSHYYIKEKE